MYGHMIMYRARLMRLLLARTVFAVGVLTSCMARESGGNSSPGVVFSSLTKVGDFFGTAHSYNVTVNGAQSQLIYWLLHSSLALRISVSMATSVAVVHVRRSCRSLSSLAPRSLVIH